MNDSMKIVAVVAVLAVMLAGVAVMSEGEESEGATTLLYTVSLGDDVTADIYDDGYVIIFGSGAMNDFTSSTALLNAYSDYIVKVLIASSDITSIGNYTFYKCTSLASITILSGATSIGMSAFRNCSSLTYVSIPASVTSIGANAFYNCTSLSSMTISSSVTSIGNTVFYGCYSLTEITFEGSQPSIGTMAFYMGTSSHKVECHVYSPGNWAVGVLDNYANSYTTFIYTNSTDGTTATYSYTLSYSANGGSGAPNTQTFSGDSSSHTFTISSTTPTRSGYTFLGWSTNSSAATAGYQAGGTITLSAGSSTSVSTTLYAVWVADSTTYSYSLSYSANGGSGAPSSQSYSGTSTSHTFTISSTTPTRSGYTFLGWSTSSSASSASYQPGGTITLSAGSSTSASTTLYAVWVADSTTTLLYTVQLGDKVYAYIYDDGNTTVSGSGEMYDYTAGTADAPLYNYRDYIVNVTIGSGVTNIGNSVFLDCYSLASVSIPSSITSIGDYAFYRCESLASASIPSSVTNIGRAAFYGCISLASMVIPSTVTTISPYTFNLCTSLTSVTIPSSITTIDAYAFQNCTALASITIPSSVTYISTGAFRNCTSLTSITIPADVTYIGMYMLQGCYMLTSITLEGAQPSIGASSFALGTASNPTECYVYSPENWAEGVLENYSDDYTTFIFESSTTTTTTYSFSLSYDANGGSGAPSTQTYSGTTTLHTFTISSTIPTRSGYTFLGWSTSSSASTASYYPGDDVSLSASGTATNVTQTLYAVWVEESVVTYTFTLEYDANGGTGAPTTQIYTGTESTHTFTISSTIPTRDGYTFYGWASTTVATAVYSGTVTVEAGQTVTLYAVWTTTNYFTLYYDANGGSGAPSSQSYAVISTSHSFTVSSTVPTRSGYTFLGWSTSSTATTASYNSGDLIKVTTDDTYSDGEYYTTLYAVWQQITYTFTLGYNANGGSGAPSSQSYSGTSTSHTFTISSTTPTRSGYTFLGWSTNSSAATAGYQAGGTITLSAGSSTSASTTLYAVWVEESVVTYTFTLGYDANGGSGAPDTQTYSGTSSSYAFTISSTIPTRDGYTFLGWSTSSSASSASYQPGGTITLSASSTLYAIWNETGSSGGDSGVRGDDDSDGSHTFGVIDTEVFMNTYSAVITDASLDLDDYFADYENLRVNFYSFALYGSSMTINGVTIPVTGGTVTFEDTTYTLQNIYVTYEDGFVYLTFASESGSLTRSTVIGLGEEVDRVLEFDGSWYFTMGIWSGATVIEEGIEMGWEWSFDGMQAILAFVGVAILGIIIASRYSRLGWIDWLIVIIGALIAFTLAGLI